MNTMQLYFTWLLVGAFSLGLAGCGPEQKETAPVSGKVTYEGEPLPGGGTIRFVPLAEEGGKAANGVINKTDGSFTLTTYSTDPEMPDGAIIGEHRVEVMQDEVIQPAEYEELPEDADEEAEPKLIKEEVLIGEDQRIPEIYSGPESPLRVTVTESGAMPAINLSKEGTAE